MDGLMMYLRLPTQTRLGFAPEAVVPLSSEAQDEQQESPIQPLMKSTADLLGLLQPTEKEGQRVRRGQFDEVLRHNESQTFKTPDVKWTANLQGKRTGLTYN